MEDRPVKLAQYLLLFVLPAISFAGEKTATPETPAQRGYRLIVSKPYVPVEFNQATFDEVWKVWPEPLRSEAKTADAAERRRMAFSRYGLTNRPDDTSGNPLQYVVDDKGDWISNCFSCHGGKVAGQVIPGLPNSHYALQTLTEEIAKTKLATGQQLTQKEIGSVFFPLGGTNGTTNAVMFGVVLGAARDDDLNVVADRPRPKLVHHDMDAPPWWHVKKKNRLYIDGFAEKSHRALMPFMLTRENGPEVFRQREAEFRDVYAYLESLESPTYPFEIDRELADQGKVIFNRSCADCHGTYGEQETYPHRLVPIDEIGTDRVRLDGLSREHRVNYGKGWFGRYGKDETVAQPEGYLAPPLDGIWASAPYFHNGSVPTLWHVLRPDERPVVWRRSENGYDQQKVGLEFTAFDKVPTADRIEKRTYFDTRQFGKSAVGHTFPAKLSDNEKQAVLEYLKSL